jgi:hypothetical protein
VPERTRARARTRAPEPEEAIDSRPDRRALHLLLDKALDRSPDLEDGLQRLLRRVIDVGMDPAVQSSLQVLTLAKQIGETIGRFRNASRHGEPERRRGF